MRIILSVALLIILLSCNNTQINIINDSNDTSDAGDSYNLSDIIDDSITDHTGDTVDTGTELPTRYPTNRALSPFTSYVKKNINSIILNNPTSDQSVFMKAGASGTVSTNLLHCFADVSATTYQLDLDNNTDLYGTLEYYRNVQISGTTPFDRITLSAESGRTALWAMTGEPSPYDSEISAINPRFAIINYGTNDMNMGTTYESAMWPFVKNFIALLEHSIEKGVVPLITGLNPRNDNISASRWAYVYNEVTRAISEKYQLPFLNLYYLSNSLDDFGLVSDGIHGNVYYNGKIEPCIFNSSGLQYNYNNRNLYTLELLSYIYKNMILGTDAVDNFSSIYTGSGIAEDPYIIDQLPFSHNDDTSLNGSKLIDSYSSCDNGQDESGNEIYYMLTLEQPASLRIMLFSTGDSDSDIHLLEDEPVNNFCILRNDKIISGTFNPGIYYIVADTYVSSGIEHSGPYFIVITQCEDDDPDCI
ncbi:MAG: SGNH/GDSL hydrolase family protein [Deltaproteobacteria bacterium]|nr:SGNH/GDSL hydrolase family protein [Deltaproteobacteria bacterium]